MITTTRCAYNGGLTFVYKIQLTNEIFFLPAVKLGYSSSSISIDNVIFEDQINTLSGFINTKSIDPLAQQIGTVNYIDLGTSFIIHNEVFIAGLSIGHLNQPNANFNKESEEKLPISLSLQAGYEFDINPYQRRFFPEFSYLYFYGSFTKFDQTLQISLSQELHANVIPRSFSFLWSEFYSDSLGLFLVIITMTLVVLKYFRMLIYSRNSQKINFYNIILILFSSIIIILFGGSGNVISWVSFLMVTSILSTQYFESFKRKWLVEVFFTTCFLVVFQNEITRILF